MQQIKWGILGSAHIAETQLIPAIRRVSGTDVIAVASRDSGRGEQFAKQNLIPIVEDCYESLLDNPDVDAVYIPLPNHEHAKWTIRAAQSGKHVLCEKPLALNEQEVKSMIEAASTNGIVLMEAFMYPIHPQWDRVRALINSGEIGQIQIITSNFSFPLTKSNDIRMNRAYGGGALYDVGTYCVHVSRTLMQEEPLYVTAVAHFHETNDIDLTLSGILRFSGGRIAHFDCSFEAPDRQYVEIVGTSGSIVVTHPFRPDKGHAELIVRKGAEVRMEPVLDTNQYVKEIEYFCDAIRNQNTLEDTRDASLAQARTLDRLYRSARAEA